jgi:alkaline phosphatase
MKKKIFLLLTVVAIFASTVFCQSVRPKNIIILIGDGMGLSQVSASLLLDETNPYQKFSTIGLINTSSADNLVTDSGASGTAYSTGYRTKNKMIGVDENGKSLINILEVAKSKEKSTGVVVTCSVTNATPATFLVHNGNRKEEFVIAEQILKSNVDFLVGAGTDFFLPQTLGGKREDGKNYIDSMKAKGYSIITDTSNISKLASYKKAFGIFGNYALPWANKRKFTLGELTTSALTSLNTDKDGFVLMVEGSQIDWADDKNDKTYLFGELKDFNTAISAAVNFAEKDKSTLIVVLADHDTGSLGLSGKNKTTGELELVWATRFHTANFVGVFAYGPGSQIFNGFLKNFEVGRKLYNLVNPQKIWK